MSRIMVMAGGTGGHVMPALAVAECLRAHGVEVLWIGTASGLEAKLVTRAGFQLRFIHIKGLRQSGALRVLVMPFMLGWAMLQVLWIILRTKPNSILGMGGFVSAPGGLVAGLLRRPLVIHEQNAIAGLTNRYLSRFAGRVLSGFPIAHGIDKITWVGNPVRREIINIPPPQQRLRGRSGPLRVLVIGGSLGASVFNQRLPQLLGRGHGRKHAAVAGRAVVEVLHQCGQASASTIAQKYLAVGISCEVHGFIEDMGKAYSWCDLVICRAGAMTIAELCAAGVPSLLVPYPHAASDHQTANAAYLHSHAAARLLSQPDFIRGDWLEWLVKLHHQRATLLAMAQAARRLARPDAAETVAQTCMEAAAHA